MDPNTLIFSSNKDNLKEYYETKKFNDEKLGKITADYIVVATGGRPRLLSNKQCENSDKYSISSDDIFSMKQEPNKTLVVGGGYIALENAGFMSELGYDVTIMNRTDVFLRGFDRDMADLITGHLEHHSGLKLMPWHLPFKIEKN